jgi:hypothetical protein
MQSAAKVQIPPSWSIFGQRSYGMSGWRFWLNAAAAMLLRRKSAFRPK